MFANVFIKRPVLSIVCAIVITLVGFISIPTLPVEQFPNISPPQVVVTANYVGASAKVVEEAVTSVLERQINGVQGMRYMNSSSSNDGSSMITVTFQQGYNQDIAAVDVQNRVALAEPQLPPEVRQTGVSVTKQSSAIAVSIALYSNKYDSIFLSNYADLYILDTLKRIRGVGSLTPYGERRYAIRVWLDPNQLASRGMTADDVVNAIKEQNIQVGVGRIGQSPTTENQQFQIDLKAVGRLREVSEFENVILKTATDGTIVRLRDVGRAELGAENYNSFARYKGKEAVGYDIKQIPGSNALNVANAVKAEIKRLSKNFPTGLEYSIAYDPTLFVVESRNEVVKTLFESILLVVLVIFIFLQDWRTMLIPAITIPITLIGTFAFVKAFSFSLNSLTLFGLTLAIGTVVDDAIVVVESITRLMHDENLSPVRAAMKAMQELLSSVISGSLVLLAVFIPVAFFPGVTGQLYKQFALTIAFSVIISSFLAITLIPALSGMLLKVDLKQGRVKRAFTWFNNGLEFTRVVYEKLLRLFARLKYVVLALFVASLGLTGWLYTSVPSAFLPDEDQGYLLSIIQGVEGTTQEYTGKIITQLDRETLKIPGVDNTLSLGGVGFSGNIANNGLSFVTFKPWDKRQDPSQSAQRILEQVQTKASQITKGNVLAINPPAIQGLGSVGGFVFQLQELGGNDLNDLLKVKEELITRANKTPELKGVFSTYTANAPQKIIEIDRDRAKTLQVEVDDILSTLQVFLGSRYVNDFNAFSRTYRVYVQADKQFRDNPEDIDKLYVRSSKGEMIPMSNLLKITSTTGAQIVNHYNLFRSIEINGAAAPGYSSAQAIQAMEKLAAEILPPTMGFEWSGISLEEISSSGQAPIIFGLGIVFVFLILAAQYNNFVDPLIILISVPLAVLGALLAQSLRGFPNDVYCQIGLVMLIGLASKNAILIVEFANQLREEGLSITKAAITASQSRLRPILMTTLAGLVGNYPMLVASGAGSLSRLSLGTTVFGGTLVSTFLSLFVVPVLYIVITSIRVYLQKYVEKPFWAR